MKVPGPRALFYGALLLSLALFGFWKLTSNPRSAFLKEVETMLEHANRGEHPTLRKKLSPDAESYIAGNYMSVSQALLMARKLDTDQNIRYRLAQLSVFYPRDYAEIEIERSGHGGDFANARRFPVPFVFLDGQWLVAGGFRGERDFSNPFD